jgi:hypothetical protein
VKDAAPDAVAGEPYRYIAAGRLTLEKPIAEASFRKCPFTNEDDEGNFDVDPDGRVRWVPLVAGRVPLCVIAEVGSETDTYRFTVDVKPGPKASKEALVSMVREWERRLRAIVEGNAAPTGGCADTRGTVRSVWPGWELAALITKGELGDVSDWLLGDDAASYAVQKMKARGDLTRVDDRELAYHVVPITRASLVAMLRPRKLVLPSLTKDRLLRGGFFQGGSFEGDLLLADANTEAVLCRAPIAFASSKTVRQHPNVPIEEAMAKDFADQAAAAIERAWPALGTPSSLKIPRVLNLRSSLGR